MKLDYLKDQQLKATMISPSFSIQSFNI
jgi:hypothetical protein